MVSLDEHTHVVIPSGLFMTQLKFIDAHIHANNRSSEDFARLATVGCEGIVAVAGEEGGFHSPQSVLDYFNRLALVDRPRVEAAGIRCYLALGIHPAGVPIDDIDELLSVLENTLREHQAAALGEIGLQNGGAEEERVLSAQLEIAAKVDLPVVLHTPRKNKKVLLGRILQIISDSRLAPERVLLDHLNGQVLPEALGSGCMLGLSVHPAKLSPAEACEVVAAYDPARLILSTDMGSNPSYLFGIPAAVSAMRDHGLAEEIIRAVAYDNAKIFVDHS